MPIISYARCVICDSDKLVPFAKRGEYGLLKCERCKLIFCNNIELEKIRKFYLEEYFEKTSQEVFYETMGFVIRHYAKVILNWIEKYKKEPGDILDVGAGFGYFLNEARLREWRTFGIEASKKGCLYSGEHFKIPLVNSLFEHEDTSIDKLKFDVITFLGVLDHSTAPHKMLTKAHSLLRSNGLVVSTALNIDWWLKLIDFRPPAHLFYFSKNNLSQLYKKIGFRIIINRPFWVPFSLTEFVRRVFTYYIRFPKFASCICSPINLLFKNIIVKWPNENLIIAQKVVESSE